MRNTHPFLVDLLYIPEQSSHLYTFLTFYYIHAALFKPIPFYSTCLSKIEYLNVKIVTFPLLHSITPVRTSTHFLFDNTILSNLREYYIIAKIITHLKSG